ncbi:MAG: hypothetical protein HGB37_03005 [Candidatus Moranbacteria bacterium]|nr:hypothetical protein [Candidatus Moranbacteria bacterium]
MQHKGNSGTGYIARDAHTKRDPKKTLQNVDAWLAFAKNDARRFVDETGLRSEIIHFWWAAQWPGILDFFSELLVKDLKKGKLEPTAILPLPGEDAFGYPVAMRCRCGLLQTVPGGYDDKVAGRIIRFRTCVGEKERVLVLAGMISETDIPELETAIRSVRKLGGRVIGIGCAVNDTFPLRTDLDGIPIVSVLSPEISRFRVASAGMDTEVVEDFLDPSSWEHLVATCRKKRKK